MTSKKSARKARSAESPEPDQIAPDELRSLREMCDRSISNHGLRRPSDTLAELATLPSDDLAADIYGQGGSVTILENEVRKLLEMPAAVFMPSGTMIQMTALRIHADRRGTRVVAFHPTCHLELHEDKAYQRLHGLLGLTVGNPRSLITIADLQGIHEPIAALLLELPQREIGGQLPTWKELKAQVAWARDRGAAVHMDGARLWECGSFYDRPLAEIAALFDTVYVSFYKGIGAVSGGMLLGSDDVIAEAREWRHRHGGTLYGLWPYAASALAGLRMRLPRMHAAYEHALDIAATLSKIDGVEVAPNPPQTPMMHLLLRTTPRDFTAGVRRLATEEKLWTWGASSPTDVPGYRKVELYVGDATMELDTREIAAAVRSLMPA